MKWTAALAGLGMLLGAAAPLAASAADLPDLAGREIVIVTENAYPPLQFLDKAGTPIGWEYDMMAEVAKRLSGFTHLINVQGDEPLIDTASIHAVAQLLNQRHDCSMSTVAHAIDAVADFRNPNVVKVVLDAQHTALYFSRAPIAWWRDGFADGIHTLPSPAPLRHVGLYGYRVGFLRQFPQLSQAPIEVSESLEQLRALWHGHRIAVHITEHSPGPGVDTPEDLARVRAVFAQATKG